MKYLFSFSSLGSAIFLWGWIFGSGILNSPEPISSQNIQMTTSTPSLTPPVSPTMQQITPIQAIAFALIIPDTPQPYQPQVQIDIPIIQEIPTIRPANPIYIPQDPNPIYLDQWIIPLDPTIQVPGVPSPYDAQDGQTAQIIPQIQIIPQGMTLDSAWDQVTAAGLDDRFPACVYPLPIPFVDWQMALDLSIAQTGDRTYTEIKMTGADIATIAARGGASFPAYGILQIPEDSIFPLLIPYYQQGTISICRDANNKPNVYGAGVQSFMDTLANSYMGAQ